MRINGQVWLSVVIAVAATGLGGRAGSAPAATPSLCTSGETAVLACGVGSGKIVSLCARDGKLQYRFGKAGAHEMTWPAQPETPRGLFFLSTTTYSGGGEERIRFSNGGYDYIVFQRTIALNWNPDGTREHFQDEGVAVLKDGKIVGKKICVLGLANDGFPKMYDLLEREETEPLDIPCCARK